MNYSSCFRCRDIWSSRQSRFFFFVVTRETHLEMRDTKNAVSCLAESSSVWLGFKNIQINEIVETTCREIIASLSWSWKLNTDISQLFIDIRNTSTSIQRITSRLQQRVMNSCSLLHREDFVRELRLESNSFELERFDQYDFKHCETQESWVLWARRCYIMSWFALEKISWLSTSRELQFVWVNWERHTYSRDLWDQE